MISFDEYGEIIPNFGDYKDPEAYIPYVVHLDKDEDVGEINEMVAQEQIYGKYIHKDDTLLVFDDTDGVWRSVDINWARMLYRAIRTLESTKTFIYKKGRYE